MSTRSLDQLLNTAEPAWPFVQGWINEATNRVEVLPATEPSRNEALLATQVTTRSPMGAVVYETGGLLVDSGWVRILGSGHPRLPRSLPTWNRECEARVGAVPGYYLVADDVVGGFFALNGGRLGPEQGDVYYFPPDSLEWESLDMGYSDFLNWSLTGNLGQFYQDCRWPGWEDEVSSLPGDQGYSIYPFLFCEGPSVPERHRRAVPLSELFGLYVVDVPRQIVRDQSR